MADIPRDPRQLARDILAGKVRIEDLAVARPGEPEVLTSISKQLTVVE